MNLPINPDIVRQIIQHAREFHVKEEADFEDEDDPTPEEHDWLQFLAENENDLTYQRTVQEINDLEPDQQITLIALLYLGRGDYTLNEWPSALNEAKSNWKERTGEYLLGHPLLADYFEEALHQFGYEVGE